MGSPAVISETLFASHYASLWRSLTPALEEFVRRANMDGYEREWVPMPAASEADRRGIVNEAGFLLFKSIAFAERGEVGSRVKSEMRPAFATATEYVDTVPTSPETVSFSVPESREAAVIAARLYNFFSGMRDKGSLVVSPPFKGSGVISSCFGDVLVGSDRLFEVKNGDRSFRSVDYRQLIVYLALNFAENGIAFRSIGLVNCRRGISVEVDTEHFARSVSGQSAVSLCHFVIEAMSASLVSE
jgi:hypothetical protein